MPRKCSSFVTVGETVFILRVLLKTILRSFSKEQRLLVWCTVLVLPFLLTLRTVVCEWLGPAFIERYVIAGEAGLSSSYWPV